ncbi:MAG TPA: LCP family protein [Solirubrobacteraceae bacterium]|jgi:LCP family protein required for cell wall assembly|nr:LCP family protein [Solirubrobacteraceae bacterium]
MLKRFVIAGALIVALSGAATATIALNTVSGIAAEVFPTTVHVPKSVVTPVYSGGPQTFLILGSDRRPQAKDALDRNDPPHSDTILLVRFDPEQGQTSMLSIPRDLEVDITAPDGEYFPGEKVNAAYTIGARLGGTRGAMLLAAETIEHQVFPTLKLNGIVDVDFAGFINVVDALGCVYVNVDHRYFHLNGPGEEQYSEINLQPGYQKLCYQSALSYVRYRHQDSDFVRVARQQDFLRDLREQISTEDVLGQIDAVAKAVGHAIVTTFHHSASQLIELAKLVAFSQAKPLRQVKFRALDPNAHLNGASYVTSTPELEEQTLAEFLASSPRAAVPGADASSSTHVHKHASFGAPSAAALALDPVAPGERPGGVAFPLLFPTLQAGPATEQTVRTYDLRDREGRLRHAYVAVWQRSSDGGYYDFEGSDWPNPPFLARPDQTRRIGGRTYLLFDDGGHVHTIAWHEAGALYWLTNTLLEDLSNAQMLAIARSAAPLP